MRKIIFILLSAVLSLTACKTIHEYPEEPGVDPSLIDVKLSLDIDMELNDGDPIIQTYMDMLGSAYDIRYIVEIYKVSLRLRHQVHRRDLQGIRLLCRDCRKSGKEDSQDRRDHHRRRRIQD